MQSIIYALIAFFTWGIGITFEAIAARRIESKSFAFWGFFLSFIITSFYAPFTLSQLSGLNWFLIGISYLIAFLIIAGVIFYYEALKQGNPSLVGAIGSSFPFVAVILSAFIFKERLNSTQIIVIIMIFTGLIISVLDFKEFRKKRVTLNKGVFFALITMLCWGMYSTLIKIPISKIGWFWPNWLFLSSFPLIYVYLKLTKTKLEVPRTASTIVPVVLSIIFVRIAEFAYNLGLTRGNVSIVAPIAGANPILFVVLSYFIFKEPLKKHQIFGITLTLIGIVFLSALSS